MPSRHVWALEKTKVLVVDTLVIADTSILFEVLQKVDGIVKTQRSTIGSCLTSTNKLVIPLALIDSTDEVKLPFDDSGGMLSLKKLYSYAGDTIRIAKLHVLHNCLPDTLANSLTWYRKVPKDTINSLRKLKSGYDNKTALPKECNQQVLSAVTLTVNSHELNVPLSVKPRMEKFSIYHGYKKGWRNRRRYEQSPNSQRPYTYFVASRCVFSYYYFGELSEY